jgi:poly-gamma-glutamate system protein
VGEPVKTDKRAALDKKTTGICLAILLWAILAAQSWRIVEPDPDCVRAVSLYKAVLEKTAVVGLEYSSLTTTLGSFAAKKSSEDPVIAALMVRLLKDAGVAPDSVAAVNASGSFPGFTLAALAACTALGIKARVIASIGASSYGANVPGNTIADMLLEAGGWGLDYTLLAVSPGGSDDYGSELDPEELKRISDMLESRGILFIRPTNLAGAVAVRESLFNRAGCTLLITIGGNHASSGADTNLALMSGVLKPRKGTVYSDTGLIQRFWAAEKAVIQILNVQKLYDSYGLVFDKTGKLVAGGEKIYRWKKISPLVMLLPALAMVIVLGIFRYSPIGQRCGQRFIGP